MLGSCHLVPLAARRTIPQRAVPSRCAARLHDLAVGVLGARPIHLLGPRGLPARPPGACWPLRGSMRYYLSNSSVDRVHPHVNRNGRRSPCHAYAPSPATDAPQRLHGTVHSSAHPNLCGSRMGFPGSIGAVHLCFAYRSNVRGTLRDRLMAPRATRHRRLARGLLSAEGLRGAPSFRVAHRQARCAAAAGYVRSGGPGRSVGTAREGHKLARWPTGRVRLVTQRDAGGRAGGRRLLAHE
jgi:hypothetical protein